MRKTVATVAFIVFILISFGSARADFNWVTLDYPGATATYAHGVNNIGQIVGGYRSSENYHGFLLDASFYSPITSPETAGNSTYYYRGINNTGQIVGDYYMYGSGSYGFVLSGSAYTPISSPSASSTTASGINDKGQMVGSASDASGNSYGFLLTGSNFTAINYPEAYNYTSAHAINNLGQIVGSYWDGNRNEGFLLTGSTYVTITYPGASGSYCLDGSICISLNVATGINDMGQIVGDYTADNALHGYVFTGGTYISLDHPGAVNTSVSGINNAGQIVGSYMDTNGVYHGFLATPVPLPSAALLLASGFAALVTTRRRCKK